MAEPLICPVARCGKRATHKGHCATHYNRLKRHGSTDARRTCYGEPWDFLEKAVIFCGDDCLIWPYSRDDSGYARIAINRRPIPAYRLVCERVYGSPPSPQHYAVHSCGNGHLGCVNKRHLRWATPSENQQDSIIHGTRILGERHPMAKLNRSQVNEIISLKGTASQSAIAGLFGVSRTLVSMIHRGVRWNNEE